MPCRCDHMEPSAREAESKRVAILLDYFMQILGVDVPQWVYKASTAMYGDLNRADDLTEMLCNYCQGNQDVLETMSDRRGLELRLWWAEHQEADAEREAKEKSEKARDELRGKAYFEKSLEILEKHSPSTYKQSVKKWEDVARGKRRYWIAMAKTFMLRD